MATEQTLTSIAPRDDARQAGDTRVTLIAAESAGARSTLRELWRAREIVGILAWRDVKVRYKQTFIGIAWAVLQPFLTMVVFTIIFGKFANFPSQGLPYQVFVYSGLVPWTFFASALSLSAMSVVSNKALVGKVYFPRLALPVAGVLVPAIDFVFAFTVLFGIMAWFGVGIQLTAPLAPVFLLTLALTAFGVGCTLAALNVRYRDVPYVIPFLVQTWLFVSPVIYATASLPERWQWLFSLNPVVFSITGFRWALTGTPAPTALELGLGLTTLAVFVGSGLLVFRRFEARFADTI
jgi:lipopolysaccharide transport system permease protein